MDSLSQLKMLLGIEDSKNDGLLSFLISDTENMILSYCHLEIMPRQLESLVPIVTAEMYRRKRYGQAEYKSDVKSISEGDRSISFESTAIDTDSFLKEYEARLKPFKCKKAKLPSEVVRYD